MRGSPCSFLHYGCAPVLPSVALVFRRSMVVGDWQVFVHIGLRVAAVSSVLTDGLALPSFHQRACLSCSLPSVVNLPLLFLLDLHLTLVILWKEKRKREGGGNPQQGMLSTRGEMDITSCSSNRTGQGSSTTAG